MHNFNTTTLGAHGEGFNLVIYELTIWRKIINDVVEGLNYARSHGNYFGMDLDFVILKTCP
jgi:hypothetical protein